MQLGSGSRFALSGLLLSCLLFSLSLLAGPTHGADFRIAVACDEQSPDDCAAGLVESIDVELSKREQAIDLDVAALPSPVSSHEQALRHRGDSGPDVVVWGGSLNDPGRAMLWLSVLRSVDRDGFWLDLVELTNAGHLLDVVERMPYDRATRIGPWTATPEDLGRLATVVMALAQFKTGSYAQAAQALEPFASDADLAFYRGLALLRGGRPEAARRAFERVSELDEHHLGARLGLIGCHHRDVASIYEPRSRELILDAARVAPLDARTNLLLFADAFIKKSKSREAVEEHLWRICRDPGAEWMSPVLKQMIFYAGGLLDIQRYRGKHLANGPLGCSVLSSASVASDQPRSLACTLTRVIKLEIPGCEDWQPDAYRSDPIAFTHLRQGAKPNGSTSVQTLLELAAKDPALETRAGKWAFAASQSIRDGQVALDWLDGLLDDPRMASALNLEVRGLLLLVLDRPEESAATLDRAAEVGDPVSTMLPRHRALAWIAASKPNKALDAIDTCEFPERALALAASGRVSEAYQCLESSDPDSSARLLATISAELTHDESLRAAFASLVQDNVRHALARAALQWQIGARLVHMSLDIDPVTLPGCMLVSADMLTLDFAYGLPMTSDEFVETVREIAGSEVGRQSGVNRKQARRMADRLDARAEAYITDQQQDMLPGDWIASRALEPRWSRLVAEGRADQVAARLESMLAKQTSDQRARVQLAAIELLRDNNVRAAGLLDPVDDVAAARMIETLTRSGAIERSRLLLESIRSENAGDPAFLMLESLLLSAEDRAREAEQLLAGSSVAHAESPHLWAALGILRADALDDCERAVEAFDRALELFSNYSSVRMWQGYCYDRLERFTDAEERLVSALETGPNNGWAWSLLGKVHQKLRRFDQAIEDQQRAIAIDDGNATAWSRLGSALSEVQAYEESALALNRSIDLGNDTAWARRQLGFVTRQLGRLQESEHHLRAALEMDADSTWGQRQLGWTLHELGRSDEAEAAFRRAVSLEPTSQYVGLDLADFLMYRGRSEEAHELLTDLLDSNPDAGASVGLRFRFLGYRTDARRVLEQVVKDDPEDVEARLSLGRIQARDDRPDSVYPLLASTEQRLTAELETAFDVEKTTQLAYVMTLTGRQDRCRELLARAGEGSEPPSPGELYEFACVSALNGDLDRALTWLERAVAAGYRYLDWMRVDPDLAGLIDDPRFQALVRLPSGER